MPSEEQLAEARKRIIVAADVSSEKELVELAEDLKGEVGIVMTDWLRKLIEHGGFYECPEGPDGELLGPLVGYAGTYEHSPGCVPHNFVGKVYYNFSQIEERPRVLAEFAKGLAKVVRALPGGLAVDRCLGAPMGGLALATALAYVLDVRYGFPDKKVTALRTVIDREQSEMFFGRHSPAPGENILLTEDVCNNFSTTEKMRALIEAQGARLVGVVCAVNRSEQTTWEGLPVMSLIHIPTEQFEQEDPVVASHIQAGNLVLKPKLEWPRFREIMLAQ